MSDNDYTEQVREALKVPSDQMGLNDLRTIYHATPALLAEVDELRAYKAKAEKAREALSDAVEYARRMGTPEGLIHNMAVINVILTDWSRDE